jgi:ribosomal protein S10
MRRQTSHETAAEFEQWRAIVFRRGLDVRQPEPDTTDGLEEVVERLQL